jgi:O-antigen/teichoic acid export membrane protein
LFEHFARSWPIGVSFLFSNAALRFPVLVLGVFGTKEDVGAFAAVDMFVTAGTILQSAVTNTMYPRLAASYRHEPRKFSTLLWTSNALLFGIGLVMALGLAFLGETVIASIFPGRDFARMVDVIPIIAWSTPILLLVHHNIFIFAAADKERSNLRFMAFWCCAIGVAQLILVPRYGLSGAAWGLLVGRLVGMAALVVTVRALAIHRGGATPQQR